jgi:hypothetical protein
MRNQATSTILAAFLAVGLTAHGNPDSRPLWRERVLRISTRAVARVVDTTAGLLERFTGGDAEPGPGPTCALVVSSGAVVGVDRAGYPTCLDGPLTGEHAAITGCPVRCEAEGERLSAPGVILGLAVVEAFSHSGDLAGLLSEVNVADLENPRAVLCGGITVEMGTGAYAGKVRKLHELLLQAPEIGIRPTRVDMRFGPQVVVEYQELKAQARKEV